MVESNQEQAEHVAGGKQRMVHACNFRSAGRMSNENARALTAIHETFARHLTTALDAYLGTDLKVKLQSLEQTSVKEHIASIPAFTYIVPFASSMFASTMIAEFDIDLVFPILDLLLGGTGTQVSEARELSEIEEEIMQDLAAMFARQAEGAWAIPAMSLEIKRRIDGAGLHQYCPAQERVTLAKFEIEVAGITGLFHLMFPSSFLAGLIKLIKQDEPKKKGRLRYFPTAGIRERILDCDVVVAADLPGIRVSVRDLIALQPGCVLKLRAPVRSPGMLTVGGCEIFEAAPVRNGAQKAAQLGRKVQPTSWGRE
jgi:flagellar motor switch protein FliM